MFCTKYRKRKIGATTVVISIATFGSLIPMITNIRSRYNKVRANFYCRANATLYSRTLKHLGLQKLWIVIPTLASEYTIYTYYSNITCKYIIYVNITHDYFYDAIMFYWVHSMGEYKIKKNQVSTFLILLFLFLIIKTCKTSYCF